MKTMTIPMPMPMPKYLTAAAHSLSTIPIFLIFLLTTISLNPVVSFSFSSHVTSQMRSLDKFDISMNQSRSKSSRRQRYRRDRQQLFQMNAETDNRHDYILEAKSDPDINETCRFTEDQIHLLIAKRLESKKGRDFDDADRILEALNENGIYLQDKKRKYRVDGENHFGRRKRYVQRGGSYELSKPEDLALVAELVEERARYKILREYHRSDDITKVLKDKYGVRLNDRRREWTVEKSADREDDPENEYYVPTPLAPKDHVTHTMSDETKEIIRDRLRDRWIARRNKKYKIADEIRDELVEDYSIVIDDRTKEWKVVTADSFFDDYDDPFAREAQMSQRSAFVQKETEIPFRNNGATIDNGDDNERPANRDDSLDDVLSRIISKNDADTVATLPSPEPLPEDEASSSSITTTPTIPTTNEISTGGKGSASATTTTAEATTGETFDGLSALTVVALKEKLRMAGLPVSGRKSELIDRLLSPPSNV